MARAAANADPRPPQASCRTRFLFKPLEYIASHRVATLVNIGLTHQLIDGKGDLMTQLGAGAGHFGSLASDVLRWSLWTKNRT